MTTTAKTRRTKRPSIILSETDADRLYGLAEQARAAGRPEGDALIAEIERAQVRSDHLAPAHVVGMNATVTFVDEAHGAERTVRLVYPGEADIAAGKVSVLTPIGAGLIGLSEGQSIDWPDRDGRVRALRVVKVMRGPVAP